MDDPDRILGKKKVFFLFGLLFLLLALPLALLLVQRQQHYQGRAYLNLPPKSVHVTNIYAMGFTVSWTTDDLTTGRIKFCGTDTTCVSSNIIEDVRGAGAANKTHYINVSTPISGSGSYYFYILSGDNGSYGVDPGVNAEQDIYTDIVVKPGGALFKTTTLTANGDENNPHSNPPGAYSIEKPLPSNHPYYTFGYASFVPCPDGTNTLPTNSCFRPNPIYGEIKNTDNTTPFPGAIIYALIKDANGNTKTRMLSTLAESSIITPTPPNTVSDYRGRWVFDMANFYKSDGTGYYGYTPGSDTLKIEAEGSPVLKITSSQLGIPEVINPSCYADAAAILNCANAPSVPAGVNPLNLTLQLLTIPTNTPTPTPTPTTIPGTTPTSIPGNKRDVSGTVEGVPDGKVNSIDAGYILKTPFPCAPAPYPDQCPTLTGKSRDVSGTVEGVPDGKVNSIDAGYILKTPFPCAPAPYPDQCPATP